MTQPDIKDRFRQLFRKSGIAEALANEFDSIEASHQDLGQLATAVLLEELSHESVRLKPAASTPGSQNSSPPIQAGVLQEAIAHLSKSINLALTAGKIQMTRALGEAVAQRDTGDSRHNSRVTLYAVRLAEAMKLESEEIQSIIKGAFLHDIGKIGIGDEILLKRGKLSAAERQAMEGHPEMGARIVSKAKWLDDALPIVRHHHERFDGTGYPDRLAGNDIPLEARLFAVVDVFDALVSERPYKPSAPFSDAVSSMREQSGSHFCPEVFASFEQVAETVHRDIAPLSEPVLDAAIRQVVSVHYGIHPKFLDR